MKSSPKLLHHLRAPDEVDYLGRYYHTYGVSDSEEGKLNWFTHNPSFSVYMKQLAGEEKTPTEKIINCETRLLISALGTKRFKL